MEKLKQSKNTEALKETIIRLLIPYKGKIHTTTSGNSKEFAEHKSIVRALDIDFYFSNPYSIQLFFASLENKIAFTN